MIVILTLNNTSRTTKSYSTLTLGKTNWPKFQNIIENKKDLHVSLESSSNIDLAVQFFTTLI